MNMTPNDISAAFEKEARLRQVAPIIRDLYISENIPARLVTSILETLYAYEISPGNLRKKFVKKDEITAGIKKRTRVKAAGPRKERATPEMIKFINMFHFKSSLQPQPVLRRYRLHEKALYSISQFLDSMFDTGNQKAWRVNPTGFVRQDGTNPAADKWQLIEASCDSISTMVRCNQVKAAQQMLDGLESDLVGFLNEMDPLFVGKIWRLALVLQGLGRRAPRLQAMETILGRMRIDSHMTYGSDSPSSAILDCILDVEEKDFRLTMRLGFQETLKVLDHKGSDANTTTLSLWSTYSQYFCKPYTKWIKRKPLDSTPSRPPKSASKAARKVASESPPQERLRESIRCDILLLKFDQVKMQCYNTNGLSPIQSDACVLINHYFAYAAYWICSDTERAERMAHDIINETRNFLTAPPVWTIKTMAFCVASKILAEIYRQCGQFRACEEIIMEVIGILRFGDRTCRVRAINSERDRRASNMSELSTKLEV
ncbi:subunit P of phosphatidylinositol N-acetylglucosaminyltransferase [Fusarium austroafricanum]|uniref:Subunit P of phosphatidylinositol N-acetylglucosaminyltransferase n=1 Tax=Fusarium austroafricanum TaxID=2364996 RepID=A0A8H4NVI0_9HYPO|nr:subunit P of phosphatidylinositol N-acetylglucosaminyltransferase [Fusarium austroafricanum]